MMAFSSSIAWNPVGAMPAGCSSGIRTGSDQVMPQSSEHLAYRSAPSRSASILVYVTYSFEPSLMTSG